VYDPTIGYYQPRSINVPFNSSQVNSVNGYDDRQVMSPYFNINILQCPPAGKVNLKDSLPTSYAFSSYNLWMGWQYREPSHTGSQVTGNAFVGRGMMKLGDRLQWNVPDVNDATKSVPHEFNVLGGDVADVIWTWWTSAHPDVYKNILNPVVKQDVPWTQQDRATRGDPDACQTEASWQADVFDFPGHVDLNFVWDDGSVRRLDNLYWDSRDAPTGWGSKPEPRTIAIPCFIDDTVSNFGVSSIPKCD
jgi:hypothetical protein